MKPHYCKYWYHYYHVFHVCECVQDERNQVLTTYLWIRQVWYDAYLKWDKEEYNNLEMINIPSDLVWKPDIVLYNKSVIGRREKKSMWTKTFIVFLKWSSYCIKGLNMFYFNAERTRSLPVIPVPMWSCVTTGRSYGTRLQSLRARAWWTSPTSLLTGSSATLPSAHGPTMATRYVKAGEWMRVSHPAVMAE